MSKLRPTLWRTCRVIASETRLKLLWEIFEAEGLPVCGLGQSVRISDQNASFQLRLLNSRGLITPHRAGMELVYGAETNEEVEYAQDLLDALYECHQKKISLAQVFRSATACTHERRIRILQLLSMSALRPAAIEEKTGIGARALYRHLSKLESRGFVKNKHGLYCLAIPSDPLGKCLLNLASRPELKIFRVVSGGQTGADRAALDAAIACGVPHGGWCPKGRRAEDGPIPTKYSLREMETDSYSERTKANVADSDLTLIFSHGPLTGGSLLTQQFAEELGKPCVHIDLSGEFQTLEEKLSRFGNSHREGGVVLNVAGPRASGDPQIYDAVYEQVLRLLR